MSKSWCDGDSEHCVPDEKSYDGGLGDLAFFPSDFRMGEVGDNGSNSGGDEIRKPEEVVVFDDEVSKNGIEAIIKKGNADADEEIAGGVTTGFDVFFGSGSS